ncbi:hypothetical protein A2V82_12760 [candidate division KSB1 bacterium RBG_16_48_16]|nr:MAG: hypothetical protein A2V82_12760 [candidate division KSB1 bacterium RBG_16_48_16]
MKSFLKNKKHLINFFHSLSFKLFIILLLIVIISFRLYSSISSNLQEKILEDTVRASAYRVSDVVKESLYRLMLKNERDALYSTIQLLGNEPGMERICIYNKKGEIKFSTKENEMGHSVDMKAEACYTCHVAGEPIQSLPMKKKTRIYRAEDGRRVMGMINPIRNAQACSNAACHVHPQSQTILGVLDVQMSLNELDQARLRAKVFASSVFIGFVLLTLILVAFAVYYLIYRPVHSLRVGTASLASGKLETRIKMQRRDELGMLARSFNNMAANLESANTELKSWSNQLEKRVEEKTTELERIHHEMLQVEKMASLGKMAASVAHELNNPLAGIVTYAKLLKIKMQNFLPEIPEKDKIISELELIRSESMRCGNIVRNLLTFARGKTTHFREYVLEDIVEDAFKIIHHHLELAPIEVSIHIEIQPKTIVCDPDQLVQSFVALLINAIEAMPGGGRLEFTAQNSENEEWVVIKIRDTGIGIPEDVKDKVLEPFFTTKTDKDGVGLGLAVVYGIIQRHKGKMWLESKDKEGTTVFIELPLKHIKTEEEEPDNPQHF